MIMIGQIGIEHDLLAQEMFLAAADYTKWR